ncbi:MAG: glycosyltransferase family A protein, partial [Oscillospiraceae bacterium]|nr:glycosyltransferase family A protein [Oscillospiraceae bacterium]
VSLWLWRFSSAVLKIGARTAYRKGLPAYRGATAQPRLTRSPFISVLVRTCGNPKLLAQALQSLQNQSYHNFEVIVVEDGPNTAGEMIAQEFADLDVRYFWLGEYLGKGYAANYAMSKARGEFLNCIDEDNLLYPDHLALFAAVLQQHSEADMVLTTAMIADLRTMPKKKYTMRTKDMYLLDYDRIDIFTMCQYNRLPLATVLFKRALYMRAGGMDETLAENEAWLMWLRYLLSAKRANPYGVDIERATCICITPKNLPQYTLQKAYSKKDDSLFEQTDMQFTLTPAEMRFIYREMLRDVEQLKKEGRLEDFLERNLQ